MQSAASDLELLESAAREAGELARTLMRAPLQVQSKGAAGPVTNVDFAVDALLTEKLRTARPSYGWLSEEAPDKPLERIKCVRAFMLDPIDGTAAMIAGAPEFTISIGVVQDGRAWAGVVYNPMTDALFSGAIGLGATLNGKAVHTTERASLEGATMISQKSRFADRHWRNAWPRMEIIAKQSIAYRLALVAAGMADATVLFGFKNEWDVAAGAALVEAAGGRITDPWGAALMFNQFDPRGPGAAAAGAPLHPLLIERTQILPDPRQAE